MKKLILSMLIACAGLAGFRCDKKPAAPAASDAEDDEIVIVPEGVSLQRVADLGLRDSAEHNPGILKESDLRFPKEDAPREDEYRATPELEWVVAIHPPKGFAFTKDRFNEVFDIGWRQEYPSQFYAHFPTTGLWSFAIAGDSPDVFDSLELAVPLADRYEEAVVSVEHLEARLRELKVRLAKFGATFQVVPRESAKAAVLRSAELKKFQSEVLVEVAVILQAKTHFESLVCWNTLVDLGLQWGDGDLFHWQNSNAVGGDYHFDVWTTTSPGYFMPEDVAAKTFRPENLVFGFVVPRSADAEQVFDQMVKGMEYCQTRLGGTLLNADGSPFNAELYRAGIRQTLDAMKVRGITPGQGVAMQLF